MQVLLDKYQTLLGLVNAKNQIIPCLSVLASCANTMRAAFVRPSGLPCPSCPELRSLDIPPSAGSYREIHHAGRQQVSNLAGFAGSTAGRTDPLSMRTVVPRLS